MNEKININLTIADVSIKMRVLPQHEKMYRDIARNLHANFGELKREATDEARKSIKDSGFVAMAALKLFAEGIETVEVENILEDITEKIDDTIE